MADVVPLAVVGKLDRKFAELRLAYRCLLAAVISWSVTLYPLGVVPPPT